MYVYIIYIYIYIYIYALYNGSIQVKPDIVYIYIVYKAYFNA